MLLEWDLTYIIQVVPELLVPEFNTLILVRRFRDHDFNKSGQAFLCLCLWFTYLE